MGVSLSGSVFGSRTIFAAILQWYASPRHILTIREGALNESHSTSVLRFQGVAHFEALSGPSLIAACFTCLAQQPAGPSQSDPPRFEVASIHLNPAVNPPIGNHFDPERATWTAVPLRMLIGNAFAVRPYQLIGGPGWLDTDRWDIDAKTAAPTSTMDKFRMLQPLLADRFQLKYRRETRDLPMYSLVVAKGGPKLKQPDKEDTATAGIRTLPGSLTGHKYPIQDFTGWLSVSLGLPVVDKTGITGAWNFDLHWSPDYGQTAAADDAVSLFTAIQDQMGLKLEAGKAPVEVIVIDSVQKPSDN